MRHQNKLKTLGRKASHRKALLRNLSTSLALEGKITTTCAKARALKSYFERLIALVKKQDDKTAIRTLKAVLYTENAQKKMFEGARKIEGESGWIRTTRMGLRDGDKAEMMLVEFN
jgi:large subunit ribosomal protein L17